jgi:hypothetical protein
MLITYLEEIFIADATVENLFDEHALIRVFKLMTAIIG